MTLSANLTHPYRKVETAYRFSFFTIAILFLFALFNIKYGFYIIASAETIAALLWTIMVILHQKKVVSDIVLYQGMIAFGFIVLDVLLWRGGYADAGIFWMLGFPFLAYFFAGNRWGSYWCVAYIGVFFIIQSLARQQYINLIYDEDTLAIIPSTLFVFSVLAYFYEQNRAEALHNEHLALHALQQEMKQRKQETHDLACSQTRIKAMLSDMREAIFQLDLDGHIIMVSPSMQHITHYTQQEALNMSFRKFFANEKDTTQFHQAIHHYGQVRNFEVAFKSATQQRVFVSINARLTYNHQQNITGIEGIVSDITQITQSENAMQLLIQELRKSRDMALASNRAKTNFISLISHELRTPLHSLMGIQDILITDNQSFSQEQQGYLQASKQATLAINHLLNDIICVSQNQATTQQDNINLVQLLCEAMNHHSAQAKEKNLGYRLHLWNIPQSIISHESQLRQILFNLVAYVIKQAHAGDVVIHVSSKAQHLLFMIHYAGASLNQDELNPNPDAAADLTHLNTQHLELALVQHFLSAFNAKLHIKSQEFEHVLSLELPITLNKTAPVTMHFQGDAQYHLQEVEHQPRPPQEKQAQDLRILFAEDDRISRIVTMKRLTRAGFDVVAVHDGLQAWRILQESCFDLLLTDLRMPRLDGLALTKKIRAHEQASKQHLYILGLSAHAMQEHVEEYLACGMDAFLSKPIEPSQLLHHVNQIHATVH